MLEKHFTTFALLLKQKQMSSTKQRKLIFAALLNEPPLSMNELIDKLPGVDRSSIYRGVDVFEKCNIVKRIPLGFKYKIELSEAFTKHHHHFFCITCKRVFELKDSGHIDATIENVATKNDFVINDHVIEMSGFCNICSKK